MYSAIEDVVPHVSGYGRWPTAMEPIPQITIRGVLRNVKGSQVRMYHNQHNQIHSYACLFN